LDLQGGLGWAFSASKQLVDSKLFKYTIQLVQRQRLPFVLRLNLSRGLETEEKRRWGIIH
jgi:hypothetical protein